MDELLPAFERRHDSEALGSTPEQFGAYINAGIVRRAKKVKGAGVRLG